MITAIQFLLALSILIILHEFGHFFFARLFKTKVEKFYLFFDFLFPFSNLLPFSIFKKKIGDTEYGLGWFPLGGYVKIAGMVDESMDTEQLKKPAEPWEFRAKPAWQRLLIMLGGIIVNVILALTIFTFMFWIMGERKLPMSEVNAKGGITITDSIGYKFGFQDGDKIISVDGRPIQYLEESFGEIMMGHQVMVERNGLATQVILPENLMGQFVDNKNKMFYTYPIPAIIGEIPDSTAAMKAGLLVKDRITGINGENIDNFFAIRTKIQSLKGQAISLNILRDDKPMEVNLQVSDSGTIGFRPALPELDHLDQMAYYQYDKIKYSFLEAIPAGCKTSWDIVVKNAKGMARIFQPKTEAYKGVGSFISMAKIFGDEFNWPHFWRVTALLSLVLAFMNLLPIPGLDGGYVIFTLWEMITGKKPSDKVMEIATSIGLIIILIFMFFAVGNDIFRNFIQ